MRKSFDAKLASRVSINQLKRIAVDDAWDGNMLSLAADVIRSRELRSALGCVHPPHQRVLTRAREFTPSLSRSN